MRNWLSALLVAVIACSSFLLHGFVSGTQLPVVPDFNTTQFLGRWFQAYSDFIVMNTFERNGVCIFADYGLFKNGTVSVHNEMRLYSSDGESTSIEGFAQPDGSGLPGRLSVQLGGKSYPAPYWVIELGPVVDDKYDWMIVTDNLQMTMWVLVRDLKKYFKTYDEHVQGRLEELGFTQFWNKPLLTNHTGCTYPAPSEAKDDDVEGERAQAPRIRLSEI